MFLFSSQYLFSFTKITLTVMCAVHIALHGLWGQVGAVGFS